MIHPDTYIQTVSEHIGIGVFASRRIPIGQIVFAPDKLDIVIDPDDEIQDQPGYSEVLYRYGFVNERGQRILCWDHAKYMNHSCEPNTMSTAWGFDIAVRDIEQDEELTCEYGMLNIEHNMSCGCESFGCRGEVTPFDLVSQHHDWDQRLMLALERCHVNDQPLSFLLTDEMKKAIIDFHRLSNYRSVTNMLFVS